MEKTKMWRKLKFYKHKDNKGAIVEMPDLTSTTHLKDLIGADQGLLEGSSGGYILRGLRPRETRAQGARKSSGFHVKF